MALPTTSIDAISVPASLQRTYREAGWWRDEYLADHLYRALTARPHGAAIFLRSDGTTQRYVLSELTSAAVEVACQVRLDETRSGDELVVVYGSNSPETCVALLGACLSGLAVLPIPQHVPPAEARKRAVALGADLFLNCTPDAPELSIERHPDVVFTEEQSLTASTLPTALRTQWLAVSPSDVALVGLTAGSTAEPRAVLHSHNTLLAENDQLCGAAPPNYPNVLIATPIAHAIGWLGGLLMPLQFGLDIHLMETWNPRRALDYVRSEHVSCGGGLPALCESLIRVDVLSREDWSTIKVAGLGGAPAGAQLVEKLHEHDVFVYRSYGSTEHPSVTHSGQLTPPDRLHSEGVPLPGVELRLVDEEGLPSSESEGFIETRGPDLCIGIIDSGDRSIGERDDGWFNSGDFGRLDDQHVLRDVARTGDVAKTHGSLVNLTRIELLLSNTLGESSYALLTVPSRKDSVDTDIVLVTTAPALDLRSVRSELRSRGAAPHELPARLTMVDRIPQTSLGKIDRGRLRADLERRMA